MLTNLQKQGEDELVVMTLNLHTYQENDQARKLALIAEAIATWQVDLVAFQECAQHKKSLQVANRVREDNMAYLICQQLQSVHHQNYAFVWDWAHYGWDVWEEGLAVLSRSPIDAWESQWISTVQSRKEISARKALLVDTYIHSLALPIRFLSTHLHWRQTTEDHEQLHQVGTLKHIAATVGAPTSTTLICGDFNAPATAEAPLNDAYQQMKSDYRDTYLQAHPQANQLPLEPAHCSVLGSDPGRIDYIWLANASQLEVVASEHVFETSGPQRVSDHCAVVTRLRK